ncbi:MAG TPA: IS481 family transposase [Thermoleophilaceae bacterium]|nr:IS481 family transposase [Thermoleophilaceae bacterium]
MPDKRRWLPRWQRIELVELVVDRGWSRRQAAAWRRVSVSTVQYWVARRRAAAPQELSSGGWAEDRPSTPKRQPRRASEAVHDLVCEARRRTGWGPRLIAGELGMCHSTVSRCLERRGMSRPPRPAREAVRRYEWPCPGDLLQMDTKRFARFSSPGHAVTGDRARSGVQKRERVGYEIAHSIIDDHSRLAYTELHTDERSATVVGFVERALAFFASHAIQPSRIQTDNAWTYTHSRALARLLAERGIEHRRIRPRTPRHNGKIERYQQTLKREWGLGQRYRSSDARATALPHWLIHYNTTRPHSAIGNRPPLSRVRNHPRQNI